MDAKKIILSTTCLLLLASLFPDFLLAQKTSKVTKKIMPIPMSAEHWNFQSGKAEFTTVKNVAAVSIQRDGGLVIAKNLNFTNGTIEFDTEPTDAAAAPFVTMYFHFQDEKESECFYLRVGREENHKRNDAVQYAPFIKGVNLWDLLPQYQGPATFNNKDWNHIKLIISGMQMQAYVNDMTKPVLRIPFLESNSKQGSIAFGCFASFANVVIKPDEAEGLSPVNGIDLTDHDANYIRRWFLNQPVPLAPGRELHQGDLPTADISWDSIRAERNGLINLTRKFGFGNRQYVWLKVKIRSASDLQKKMELGFSDEVWVFLNQRMAFVDKNLFLQGMRKAPDGRCSLQNAAFTIPLKTGDNELLVGVANDFYGWGIIARFENMEGIQIVTEK